MPSLCNFEAVVLSHGSFQTRLPEYSIRQNPSPPNDSAIPGTADAKLITSTCDCYIPSTPNQSFRIMIVNKSTHDTCISVLVDGEWIYSGLSYAPNHKTIYFSGRLIDENTIQEMRFMDLDTTYDSSDGDYAKDGLGSIVVQIHRVRVTGPWEGKLPPLTPKAESKPILIGEKAAEIDADHRVGFAPPTALKKAVKPQTTEWIDPRNGPAYLEFTFHYRSRDQLREMGLISGKKVDTGNGEKEMPSDYLNGSDATNVKRRSFWSFWSK